MQLPKGGESSSVQRLGIMNKHSVAGDRSVRMGRRKALTNPADMAQMASMASELLRQSEADSSRCSCCPKSIPTAFPISPHHPSSKAWRGFMFGLVIYSVFGEPYKVQYLRFANLSHTSLVLLVLLAQFCVSHCLVQSRGLQSAFGAVNGGLQWWEILLDIMYWSVARTPPSHTLRLGCWHT